MLRLRKSFRSRSREAKTALIGLSVRVGACRSDARFGAHELGVERRPLAVGAVAPMVVL